MGRGGTGGQGGQGGAGSPGNGNGMNGGSWVWPSVIGGFLLLLQVFSGFVWGNINSELARLENEIKETRHSIDNRVDQIGKEFVRRSDSSERRTQTEIRIKNLDDKINDVYRQIQLIRQSFERRDDFTAAHKVLTDDITRVNDRLNEIRRDFGSASTLGDKIKDLQDQIRALQEKFFKQAASSPPLVIAPPTKQKDTSP